MSIPKMTTKTVVKRTIREIENFLAAGITLEDIETWRDDYSVRIDPRTGHTSDGRTACACCAAGVVDPTIPGVAGFACQQCMDMADRVEDLLDVKVFPPDLECDPDGALDADHMLSIDPEPLLRWRENVVATVAEHTGWAKRPDVALREWQQWCDYDDAGPAKAFSEMLYRLAPYLIDFDPRIAEVEWLTAPQDDHAQG